MSEDQIIAQLNPDVPPTGSDIGICNAARKSFGRRSELNPDGSLKDKDKRLLEFLARGMTADDFDDVVSHIHSEACWADVYDAEHMYDDDYSGINFKPLIERLWEWRNTPTHDTPFNHGFFSFEVKAPIFVRAQLV